MTRRDRFITALKGGIPDKVPFAFGSVYQNVQEGIVGHEIKLPGNCGSLYNGLNATGWMGAPTESVKLEPIFCCAPEVAEKLNMDAINIQVNPPLFVKKVIKGEDACVAGGLIDGIDVLRQCKHCMPDPDNPEVLDEVRNMLEYARDYDFAIGAKIRLGVSPTLLSIGMDNLAAMIAEDDDTYEQTIEMYSEWSNRFSTNLMEMGFDFFFTADDIAYTQQMMISPQMFQDVFKEKMRHAREPITVPLIYHSDGNYALVLDDLIEIGVDAIHPLERGSIDTEWLIKNYKGKVAMVGNVDINHILYDATIDEVFEDVRSRIELFGPGGGYVISDSNSIPGWCSPKNVIAMSEAVEEYRNIY